MRCNASLHKPKPPLTHQAPIVLIVQLQLGESHQTAILDPVFIAPVETLDQKVRESIQLCPMARLLGKIRRLPGIVFDIEELEVISPVG